MSVRTTRDARSRTHVRLEALDQRVVPATFTVSSASALQADVAMLSNSSVPNTIVVNQGIYNLTAPLQIQNPQNLTIVGRQGQYGKVNLLAANGNRVFEINGGNVTLSGLTIANGSGVAQGGGILSQNAVLTLKNDTLTSNTASQAGGAIYAHGGTVKILNNTITSNGVSNATGATGGAIAASNATIVLSETRMLKNTVDGISLNAPMAVTASGAAIEADGGTLSITNSTLARNSVYTATLGTSATSFGGAIATTNAAVTVTGSSVDANGLVALSAGTNVKRGSAFSTHGGSLTITNSTVANNGPATATVFDYPGATVVLKNTRLGGQQVIANRTLAPQTS